MSDVATPLETGDLAYDRKRVAAASAPSDDGEDAARTGPPQPKKPRPEEEEEGNVVATLYDFAKELTPAFAFRELLANAYDEQILELAEQKTDEPAYDDSRLKIVAEPQAVTGSDEYAFEFVITNQHGSITETFLDNRSSRRKDSSVPSSWFRQPMGRFGLGRVCAVGKLLHLGASVVYCTPAATFVHVPVLLDGSGGKCRQADAAAIAVGVIGIASQPLDDTDAAPVLQDAASASPSPAVEPGVASSSAPKDNSPKVRYFVRAPSSRAPASGTRVHVLVPTSNPQLRQQLQEAFGAATRGFLYHHCSVLEPLLQLAVQRNGRVEHAGVEVFRNVPALHPWSTPVDKEPPSPYSVVCINGVAFEVKGGNYPLGFTYNIVLAGNVDLVPLKRLRSGIQQKDEGVDSSLVTMVLATSLDNIKTGTNKTLDTVMTAADVMGDLANVCRYRDAIRRLPSHSALDNGQQRDGLAKSLLGGRCEADVLAQVEGKLRATAKATKLPQPRLLHGIAKLLLEGPNFSSPVWEQTAGGSQALLAILQHWQGRMRNVGNSEALAAHSDMAASVAKVAAEHLRAAIAAKANAELEAEAMTDEQPAMTVAAAAAEIENALAEELEAKKFSASFEESMKDGFTFCSAKANDEIDALGDVTDFFTKKNFSVTSNKAVAFDLQLDSRMHFTRRSMPLSMAATLLRQGSAQFHAAIEQVVRDIRSEQLLDAVVLDRRYWLFGVCSALQAIGREDVDVCIRSSTDPAALSAGRLLLIDPPPARSGTWLALPRPALLRWIRCVTFIPQVKAGGAAVDGGGHDAAVAVEVAGVDTTGADCGVAEVCGIAFNTACRMLCDVAERALNLHPSSRSAGQLLIHIVPKEERRDYHVLVVIDAWGRTFGGVSSFNVMLCESLARMKVNDRPVRVTCVAASGLDRPLSGEGGRLRVIPEARLAVLWTKKSPQVPPSGRMVIDHRFLHNHADAEWPPHVDVVIGHDRFSGALAADIAEVLEVPSVAFVHTSPTAAYMFNGDTDDEWEVKIKGVKAVLSRVDKAIFVGNSKAEFSGYSRTANSPTFQPGYITPPTTIQWAGMKSKMCMCGRLGSDAELKGVDVFNAIFTDLRASGEPKDSQRLGTQIGASAGVTKHGAPVQPTLLVPKDPWVMLQPYSDDAEAVAGAMAACGCLLMPSRVDSFGMVAAEAVGLGMPAIVSSRSGVGEHLRSLVKPGRLAALRTDLGEQDTNTLLAYIDKTVLDVPMVGDGRSEAATKEIVGSWVASVRWLESKFDSGMIKLLQRVWRSWDTSVQEQLCNDVLAKLTPRR